MAVVYAPEDPTLPKPWKGLLDGASGNIYYWNTETNVTQYEKPGEDSIIDDDERYNRGSNGGSKIDSGAGTHQSRKLVPAVENGASAASYQQRNEITVSGDDVPLPMTSFEAIGLPSEILREVRYLLRGVKFRTLLCPLLLGVCPNWRVCSEELNFVHCCALFCWGFVQIGGYSNGGPIRKAFRISQVRCKEYHW